MKGKPADFRVVAVYRGYSKGKITLLIGICKESGQD